jgi:prephenate dehydrogenase
VGVLEQQLNRLSALPLKPGCIITDVGSTKQSIVRHAAALEFHGACFIGGHPMAGKEKSGVEAATSLLFENAFYVLTPDARVPEEACLRLRELLKHTKAHVIQMDARVHDEIVGAISHLPHIIAAALVNLIRRYNDSNDLYQNLAAGGFRDITRIASSDPVIWRDILLHNREVLLNLLSDWEAEIAGFRRLLETGESEGIEDQFRRASEFRSKLPERRKGMISPLYECYVDIPDHPGVIGKIATELGNRQINISNIQIIESRLEVPGVMRLSFRELSDMDQAVEVLRQLGYEVNI